MVAELHPSPASALPASVARRVRRRCRRRSGTDVSNKEQVQAMVAPRTIDGAPSTSSSTTRGAAVVEPCGSSRPTPTSSAGSGVGVLRTGCGRCRPRFHWMKAQGRGQHHQPLLAQRCERCTSGTGPSTNSGPREGAALAVAHRERVKWAPHGIIINISAPRRRAPRSALSSRATPELVSTADSATRWATSAIPSATSHRSRCSSPADDAHYLTGNTLFVGWRQPHQRCPLGTGPARNGTELRFIPPKEPRRRSWPPWRHASTTRRTESGIPPMRTWRPREGRGAPHPPAACTTSALISSDVEATGSLLPRPARVPVDGVFRGSRRTSACIAGSPEHLSTGTRGQVL